jgi:hypothetical protein
MSQRQFRDALGKFGFNVDECGMAYVIESGDDVKVPFVTRPDGTVNRRASLAKLWKQYEAEPWSEE